VKALKPYVCPRCFKPSPEPDERGACPACGYTDDGSRIVLWCSLAILLPVLLLIILGTLWAMGYTFAQGNS
jgi:hypothetical protein